MNIYKRIFLLLLVSMFVTKSASGSIEGSSDKTNFRGDLALGSDLSIVNGDLLLNKDLPTISLVSNANNIALNSNLDIANQIRIRGGNPANGRVLISDASGFAVWADPSAVPGGGDFTNFGDTAFADRSFGNTDAFAMDLLTDGVSRVNISAAGVVTINPNSQDADFTFQGQNDPDLFFVDASSNSVGVGISSPSTKLQVNGSTLVGSTSTLNLSLDSSGIQASNGANPSTLRIQEHASGRVRIGNTSGLGRLGVGTDPTASLDVNGLLRIRRGNPVAGRTLVSDSNGFATWQDVSFQGERGETGDRGPKGPRGVQGDRGPRGNKGDKGNEGPVSTNCTVVSASQQNVTSGTSATVTCPSGTIRATGGVRCNSPPGSKYVIERSEPVGFTGWRGKCKFMDGTVNRINIEARAICCS